MNQDELINWIKTQQQNNFSKQQVYQTLINNKLDSNLATQLINQVYTPQQEQINNPQPQNNQTTNPIQNPNPNQKFDINNPHPSKKQILITIGILLLISLIVLTGLYFMFNSNSEDTINKNQVFTD